MISLIFRRFLTALPVLLVVITVTFFMVHSAPGGPFDADKAVSKEVLEQLNERYNLNEPVWKLLGYDHSSAKTPYFSVLFADQPTITKERAKEARENGFQAAKFGWGPIGSGRA